MILILVAFFIVLAIFMLGIGLLVLRAMFGFLPGGRSEVVGNGHGGTETFSNRHLYMANPKLCDFSAPGRFYDFSSNLRREMERELGIDVTRSGDGDLPPD